MGVPLKSRHTRNREVKEEKLKELKKVEKEIKDIHRMIAGLEGKERRSQWCVRLPGGRLGQGHRGLQEEL